MHYTRLYSDEQGESHYETVEIPLSKQGIIGDLSEKFPVTSIQFRETPADYDWDFHNAPQRQFIIMLDGVIEIRTSLGDIRTFKAGDVLLAEDTTGKGHKTRTLKRQTRKSIFIQL